jgi:hypothetical protein
MYVGETPFDIVKVRMEQGLIYFTGRHDGPVDDPGGVLRIHGPDGSVILIGESVVDWPRRQGDVIWFEQTVKVQGSLPGEPWAKAIPSKAIA